eukprot:5435552-Pyramimonas_sp.AAC.1
MVWTVRAANTREIQAGRPSCPRCAHARNTHVDVTPTRVCESVVMPIGHYDFTDVVWIAPIAFHFIGRARHGQQAPIKPLRRWRKLNS